MFRRYRNWELGEFVVVFADTAAGGGDYCAAQFLSKTKMDFPLVYHSQTIASEMTPLLHLELEAIYDVTHVRPVIAYERNNGGVYELERLAGMNRNDKYVIYQEKSNIGSILKTEDQPKLGWTTTTANRPAMLSMWKDAFDKKLPKIYDRPTIQEHFSFVIVQTSSSWKAQAEVGSHDDLVMASAGAWQLYQSEHPTVVQGVINATPQDLELDEFGMYT